MLGGAFEANVAWTAQTGTSSVGPTLTRPTPRRAWNAEAASSKAIASSDGYVELGVAETSTYRMAGLGSHDTTASYGDIAYAFFFAGDGGLHVYESGAYQGTFGTYATGDRLRVAVENGVVVYRKNGTLLFTSPTAPSLSALGGRLAVLARRHAPERDPGRPPAMKA